MAQNKTLIISFAVLLVVIIAAITPLYLQLNSLRTEVSNLSSNLSSKSEELEKSLNSLRESINAIEKKYAELVANVSALPENLRYPLTITDGLGRSVTIVSKPSRIVSIGPSVTEILFAIGAGDLVVGVDKFSNYPPLVKELIEKGKITVVGGIIDLDFEKVLALKPDVVILSLSRQAYRLAELGLTVIALKSDSIADVFDDIILLGRITGKIAGALEVITNMKNKINYAYLSVESYIKKGNVTRVDVFFTFWLEPIWTSGSNTFIDDVIRLAGGKNIFSDISGYKVVSPEAIVAKAPTIIIGATHGASEAQSMYNSIVNMEGWNTIPAVINGRVYVLAKIANDVALRPGPRVADAVLLLAIIFYPEAFGLTAKDIPTIITDPEDLFNRIHTTAQIILEIAR